MTQLSLLDILEPPPPRPAERPKREVVTRAYGRAGHVIRIDADAPDPLETVIRGMRGLIVWDFGVSTYALDPPGSLFWSGTGFFSLGVMRGTDLETVIRLVEQHIDAPTAKGGMGKKLVRWWPQSVRSWQDNLSWALRYDTPGTTMWDQWGPEKQAEAWANHRDTGAALTALLLAEGYDLNDIGPPRHHKGPWPRFDSNGARL